MCSVQVLFFAEGMQRRPFDENENVLPPRARGVCRRLFADDSMSREPASRVLRDLQTKITEETRDRWNFDFEKGVPLKGRFQWTPVCNENVCKRSVVVDNVSKKSSSPGQKSGKRRSSAISSPSSKKCKTESTSQSKITDFLKSRKQSSPSSSHKILRTANSSPNQRNALASS